MATVIALLTVLVGAILVFVEKHEVRSMLEEEKSKAVWIASYIALQNLDPLLFLYDHESVEENIEGWIDEKLIYIAFFERNNKPFAATQVVKNNPELYRSHFLDQEVGQEGYFFDLKRLDLIGLGKEQQVLEIESPIFAEGSSMRWGAIKVGFSLKDLPQQIRKTRLTLIIIGSAGLLVGILGSLLLARGITSPLKKLVEATVNISRGDFSQKIDISAQDEVGDLARSFNEMTHRLLLARERMEATNRKLIQAEKLASIGRISAGIAHEIRNPLTSVKLNIQKIFQSEKLSELEKEHLSLSQQGIQQIEKFVKELLNYTRASELNLDWFSIEEIVEESVKMMDDSLALKNIHLIRDYQEKLPQVYVDGDKIRQVVLNILRNAYEAVDDGGEIRIVLDMIKASKKIRIEISDNGPGIRDKDKELIYEPFFTTKATGIGLGLANARKVVEQHMGTISLIKSGEKGTIFEICIPYEELK
ncbi:MAG: HAMP domain-containing protein [Candidatus Aminicenantes bacterium]|nr:HAMP domain-containing protein [Candidatus Aminicenantes bacterium]